jgi:DNA-binding PadR family transcriptional regulator
MPEGRIDRLILGRLAKETIYAKSEQDLARRLVGDPTRQRMLADVRVVLDAFLHNGLIAVSEEVDEIVVDPRYGCRTPVLAYSLTDAGREALAERMSLSQG